MPRGGYRGTHKHSAEIVASIMKMFRQKVSQGEIAKKHGMTKSAIAGIVNRNRAEAIDGPKQPLFGGRAERSREIVRLPSEIRDTSFAQS